MIGSAVGHTTGAYSQDTLVRTTRSSRSLPRSGSVSYSDHGDVNPHGTTDNICKRIADLLESNDGVSIRQEPVTVSVTGSVTGPVTSSSAVPLTGALTPPVALSGGTVLTRASTVAPSSISVATVRQVQPATSYTGCIPPLPRATAGNTSAPTPWSPPGGCKSCNASASALVSAPRAASQQGRVPTVTTSRTVSHSVTPYVSSPNINHVSNSNNANKAAKIGSMTKVFHQLVDEIDQKAEHKMRQLFGEAQEMVEVREEHLHAFQGVTDRLSSIENLLCGEGEDGGHSVTTRVDQMHHRAQSHNTGILARLTVLESKVSGLHDLEKRIDSLAALTSGLGQASREQKEDLSLVRGMVDRQQEHADELSRSHGSRSDTSEVGRKVAWLEQWRKEASSTLEMLGRKCTSLDQFRLEANARMDAIAASMEVRDGDQAARSEHRALEKRMQEREQVMMTAFEDFAHKVHRDHSSEMESLRRDMKDMQQLFQAHKSDKGNSHVDLEVVRRESREVQQRCEGQRREIANIAQAVSELLEANNSSSNRVKGLEAEQRVAAQETRLATASLDDKLTEVQSACRNDISAAVATVNTHFQNLSEDCRSLRKEMTDLQSNFSSNLSDLESACRNDLENLNANIQNTSSSVSRIESNLFVLETACRNDMVSLTAKLGNRIEELTEMHKGSVAEQSVVVSGIQTAFSDVQSAFHREAESLRQSVRVLETSKQEALAPLEDLEVLREVVHDLANASNTQGEQLEKLAVMTETSRESLAAARQPFGLNSRKSITFSSNTLGDFTAPTVSGTSSLLSSDRPSPSLRTAFTDDMSSSISDLMSHTPRRRITSLSQRTSDLVSAKG